MKIKIVGINDVSYTDKETAEYKEQVEVHFNKIVKGEKFIGMGAGYEIIKAANFPEEFKTIKELGEKIIGMTAIIGKDARTFNGKAYSFVDEFELIMK